MRAGLEGPGVGPATLEPSALRAPKDSSRARVLGTAGTKSWTTHTNVAKQSARLTSTTWTGAGLGAGAAFRRRSRSDEIFVGIAVRGLREVRPPEGTLATDSNASRLSHRPQSCDTTGHRGK